MANFEPFLSRFNAPGGTLDEILGVQAPNVPSEDDFGIQEDPRSPGFLERFITNLQNVQAPGDTGFLGGFVSGLGRAGAQKQQARQKFEADQTRRRSALDEARRKSTAEYRAERTTALRDLSKSQTAERQRAAEYERDNPLVTAELKAQYPALSRIPEGQRLTSTMWNEVQKRSLPESESEKRAREAAERSEQRQQLLVQNAERANRLAEVTTTRGLVHDYSQDKAIQGYNFVQSNYKTAEDQAKLKNGVGDVALIFAWARAREPENPNVVREGEFTSASKAAGELQNIVTIPQRFLQGDRLTEPGRKMILRSIKSIRDSRRPAFDAANDQYRAQAKQFGVDPSFFIRDPLAIPARPSAAGATTAAVPSDADLDAEYDARFGGGPR